MRGIDLNDAERVLMARAGMPDAWDLGDLVGLETGSGVLDHLRRVIVLSAIARSGGDIVSSLRPRRGEVAGHDGSLERLLARQGVEPNSFAGLTSETFLAAAEIIVMAIEGTAADLTYSRVRSFGPAGYGQPVAEPGALRMRADWRSYVDGLTNAEFARQLEARLVVEGLDERVRVQHDGFEVEVIVDDPADRDLAAQAVRATEVTLVRRQAAPADPAPVV